MASAQPQVACKYGTNCYRKNPEHLKQFSHPDGNKYNADQVVEEKNRELEKFRAIKPYFVTRNPLVKIAFQLPLEEEVGAHGIKTLLELDMMSASASLRSKSDWHIKVQNTEITEKWRAEMKEQRLNDECVDYILDELKHYYTDVKTEQRNVSHGIEVSAADGTYQSDSLISQELHRELVQCSAALENVPLSQKDWHPNSNQQVLDLVHPSLFCYVNQVTRVLTPEVVKAYLHRFGLCLENNNGSMTPDAKRQRTESTEDQKSDTMTDVASSNQNNALTCADHLTEVASCLSLMNNGTPLDLFLEQHQHSFHRSSHDTTTSKLYQWLPAEFAVSSTGKVQCYSYINNLHPVKHRTLYGVIERCLELFIPMFNQVLTDAMYQRLNRIDADSCDWYEGNPEPEWDNKKTNDENDRIAEEWRENRQLTIPQPGKYISEKDQGIKRDIVDLKNSKLQVIVKMATIELTPDQPEYKGGSWHIEGMRNESIVASGIYYYASENISESKLAFRASVNEPECEQGDDEGVRGVYGIGFEDALSQPWGSIVTKEGRAICFPNTLQHQVQPFELIDRTKSGSRKILVFFLIDPSDPILSTLHVAPQQSQWYNELLMDPKAQLLDALILPTVLSDLLLQYSADPMSLVDAHKYRTELMSERSQFVEQNSEQVFQREFFLCEH